MVCVGFHEATSWPCGPRQGAPGLKNGGKGGSFGLFFLKTFFRWKGTGHDFFVFFQRIL